MAMVRWGVIKGKRSTVLSSMKEILLYVMSVKDLFVFSKKIFVNKRREMSTNDISLVILSLLK